MQTRTAARIGAACGIAWPVALSLGRDGALPLALAGLVLIVPFVAYLCTLLRAAGTSEWLTAAAFGAGLLGAALKVASALPEIAEHRVPAHTQAWSALDGLAGAATVASLYPFAVFTAIVAAEGLRAGLLPRWLGALTALTAVALAVNGSFVHTQNVPGLLLFVVWSFVVAVTLLRRDGLRGRAPRPAHATA